MSDPEIFAFVKIFSQQQYADDFVNGKIYMNRLSTFKRIESLYDEDGRRDTNEAVAHWWQPRGFLMNLNIPRVGSTVITEQDLAGPSSMSFDHHDHFHVLCMHAMYTSGLPVVNGKYHLAGEGQVAELYRQMWIDPKCSRFGPYAVIVPARQFFERLVGVLRRQGRKVTGDLVSYYDDSTFNGEIPRDRILFHKQKRFQYQREFRIAVAPIWWGKEALVVDIGDISHMCGRVPSHKLNDQVRVTVENAA